MSVDSKKLQVAYQAFFIKSFEGQEFIKTLQALIDNFHESAEKDAEKSRDYTQKARGVREVIEHIQATSAVIRKGQPL